MASPDANLDASDANGAVGVDGVKEMTNGDDNKDLNGVKDLHSLDVPELDFLLIGAGFSAFTLLNR